MVGCALSVCFLGIWEVLMVFWFVFCMLGLVAKVLNMFIFSQLFLRFLLFGGVLFLFIWVWRV